MTNPTSELPSDVEREFDEEFQPMGQSFKELFGGSNWMTEREGVKLKKFIAKALASQRAAIAEEVEKKRGDYDSRF